MRCKVGEMAVIVRSSTGEEGRILTCIRFLGRVPGWHGDDHWQVDIETKGVLGGSSYTYPDSYLRPIRPTDDPDETLSWAPVPNKVTA